MRLRKMVTPARFERATFPFGAAATGEQVLSRSWRAPVRHSQSQALRLVYG